MITILAVVGWGLAVVLMASALSYQTENRYLNKENERLTLENERLRNERNYYKGEIL